MLAFHNTTSCRHVWYNQVIWTILWRDFEWILQIKGSNFVWVNWTLLVTWKCYLISYLIHMEWHVYCPYVRNSSTQLYIHFYHTNTIGTDYRMAVIGGFPSQKANNTQLWCFFGVTLNKLMNKQSSYGWSEPPCRSCYITVWGSGARPTKHISIEFEIRWKFRTL